MFKTLTNTSNRLTQAFILLSAILFALLLGAGVSFSPLYLGLLGGMVIALAFAWWMVKMPHMTVTFFWIFFTIQATVFSTFIIQGLYYPIYALMILNVLLLLGQGKRKIPWVPMTLYAGFFILVLMSLFNIATQINFDVFQKLFIFFLGALVAFQFRTKNSLQHFAYGQIVAMVIISAWVILSAVQSGFAERGGINVNENVVSAMISLGLIPLFTKLISSTKTSLIERTLSVLAFLIGSYALLILASRGGIIALAMALFVIVMRVIFNPKRFIYVVLAAVVAVVTLSSLPGSSNVFMRFANSDLSTLNSRLPLWEAAFTAITTASPAELFLGYGFDSSRVVAATVFGTLDSIHNAYLQFIIEFGILGLILFLGIHLYSFLRSWRYADEQGLHATGTITALLFFNLTGTTPDSFIYWIALGFALAVTMIKDNDQTLELQKQTYQNSYAALEPDPFMTSETN